MDLYKNSKNTRVFCKTTGNEDENESFNRLKIKSVSFVNKKCIFFILHFHSSFLNFFPKHLQHIMPLFVKIPSGNPEELKKT